jgi:hypothetical protein
MISQTTPNAGDAFTGTDYSREGWTRKNTSARQKLAESDFVVLILAPRASSGNDRVTE